MYPRFKRRSVRWDRSVRLKKICQIKRFRFLGLKPMSIYTENYCAFQALGPRRAATSLNQLDGRSVVPVIERWTQKATYHNGPSVCLFNFGWLANVGRGHSLLSLGDSHWLDDFHIFRMEVGLPDFDKVGALFELTAIVFTNFGITLGRTSSVEDTKKLRMPYLIGASEFGK